MNGRVVPSSRSVPPAWRGYELGPFVCSGIVFFAAVLFIFLWRTPPTVRLRPTHSSKSRVSLSAATAKNATQRLGNLGWEFEPNVGQAASSVKFLARANDATVFLTGDGLDISWRGSAQNGKRPQLTKSDLLQLEFRGVEPDTQPTGETALPGKTNYLIGRNPRAWHTNVRHYASVRYAGLYSGVDARFYGGTQGLEYDLTVARDADLSRILLRAKGADEVHIDSQGNLIMRVGVHQVAMKRPRIYQLKGAARVDVSGGYRLVDSNTIGFSVGKHRTDLPLVIDPAISVAYTTFLGGAGAEKGNSVAVDSAGNIYVGGTTTDVTTFPETTPCNDIKSTACSGVGVSATSNLFVAKIDMSTNPPTLAYLTFIGGSRNDQGGLIAVDNSPASAAPPGSPNLAILGWTTSVDFPTTLGSVPAGSINLTVSKLNGAGNAFIYSEYYGGSGVEATQGTGAIVANSTGGGIATDSAGDVFVTSDTTSTDLPQPATPNGFQTLFEGTGTAPTPPNNDGFLSEFDPNGTLLYASYFGITATVGSTGVAVDSSGNAYVAGFTSSPTTFPAISPFQASYGGGNSDAYVMKINPAAGATGPVFASLLGGSGSDQAFAIALDGQSPPSAYVTGTTSSTDFVPVALQPNSFQSTIGSGATDNAFLAVVSQAPASLVYASYLGGTNSDSGQGITVASTSSVIVAGTTSSNNFPVLCPSQNFTGAQDAFIAVFNPTASGSASLLLATFLGGSAGTEANAVATDSSADAIIFGDTLSSDYPLAGSPQTGFQLLCTSCAFGTPLSDAFLTKTTVSTAPSACVAFAPASATFGPFPVGSTSAPPINGIVTNDGNLTLNFASFSVIGTNAGDFPLQASGTGVCTPVTSLPPGGTCDFSVSFDPSVAGSETATLQITGSDTSGNSLQSGVDLTGTGTAPEVSLTTSPPTTPPALTFGSVTLNTTSAVQDVTLTNTGNAPLTISSIVIDPSVGNPADFIVNPAGTASVCGSAGMNPIPPDGTCTIAVEFTPNTSGPLTGQVDVVDNSNNGSAATQTIALSGTGIAQTFIVGLNPVALTFSNQTVGATSPTQSVTLTNTGTGTLNITSISLTGPNANQFQILPSPQTTCSIGGAGVGANGGACVIAVDFTPSVVGSASASISIADNASNGPNPQLIPLSGAGTGAIAAVTTSPPTSPPSLTFGSVTVGNTSTTLSATLTNIGNTPLVLNSLNITGPNGGDFQLTAQTTCTVGGTGIVPAASCNIAVDFVPQASGSRFASVSIADNAAGSPPTISLSGTGTAPIASLSQASLAFGNVNVGSTSTLPSLTLTNTGNQALTIPSVAIDPSVGTPADFSLSGSNTCKTVGSLQPNASCTITVSFTPAAQGAVVGQVNISDSTASSPQRVALSGTGTAAGVTLTPPSLTFAGQNPGTPPSSPQTITLQNTGSGPLTISSINVTGANAGDFAETNNCPGSSATLNVGNACAIAVTFTPTGTGPRSASLAVSDDAVPSPQIVPLSGTGTSPGAQLNVPSVSFGSEVVGAVTTSQPVQVSNTGNGPLVVSHVGFTGFDPSDFQASGSCVGANGSSVSVAAGSSCTVNVAFAPTTTGSRAASLTITDNVANSPQQIPVAGTATDFQFGVGSGGSTSTTITAGETATFNLQATPTNGFTGTVSISCADPIPASTCTPAPQQLAVSGTQPTAFSVTVTTTARSAALPQLFRKIPPGSRRFTIAILLLALAFLWRWQRGNRKPRFRFALLLIGALMLCSCGGGGSAVSSHGTAAGTYTVVATGTISGTSRTVNLTITVQ